MKALVPAKFDAMGEVLEGKRIRSFNNLGSTESPGEKMKIGSLDHSFDFEINLQGKVPKLTFDFKKIQPRDFRGRGDPQAGWESAEFLTNRGLAFTCDYNSKKDGFGGQSVSLLTVRGVVSKQIIQLSGAQLEPNQHCVIEIDDVDLSKMTCKEILQTFDEIPVHKDKTELVIYSWKDTEVKQVKVDGKEVRISVPIGMKGPFEAAAVKVFNRI